MNDNLKRLYANPRIFRKFSVDYVISELLEIRREFPALTHIFFSDEAFGLDKHWMTELLEKYRSKIGLPFTLTTRADFIDDEYIRAIKDSGCSLLTFSFETANEKTRFELLDKRISNEQCINAALKLRAAGIETRIDSIFCLPGETLDDAFDNVRIFKKMRTKFPVGFLLQPFPKTKIYEYALKNGYLKKNFSFDDLDPLVYFKTPVELKDKNKIIVVQRLVYYAVRVPMFDKLLRALVYIPNNFIFDILHKISIAYSHKVFYRLSFYGLVKYLWSSLKLK